MNLKDFKLIDYPVYFFGGRSRRKAAPVIKDVRVNKIIMKYKLILIILASFLLGYAASFVIYAPTQKYFSDNIEQFYIETRLSQDIHDSYFIAKTLNELRNKKITIENSVYLELIIWNNLDVIDSTHKNDLKTMYQKKIEYIRSYKETYIKKDPNKAIKPLATLSGTFKSGVSLAFKSPLS